MGNKIPWTEIFRRLRLFLKDKQLPVVSEVAHRDRSPFKVLVSTMLSSRTKDEVTSRATERLFRKASTPQALAGLAEEEIARLIFPAGFYRAKAKNLKRMAQLLVDQYRARVPTHMSRLLALPGVGRKTANLVRNLAFGLEGICVDTHVHRISNRLGWVQTKNPAATEQALMKTLPRKYWIPINELLVTFGQNLCTPISPFCSRCPITRHCRRVGVARNR